MTDHDWLPWALASSPIESLGENVILGIPFLVLAVLVFIALGQKR